MSSLAEISDALQKGRTRLMSEKIAEALSEGISPKRILEDALLFGMAEIGERFRRNEIFVPDVLIAARAMNAGTAQLKPYLVADGITPIGRAVIGTVEGDLHDIGKNLVRIMLEARGIEVIDLGTNVPADRFVETAIAENCSIICCSALLTTTMDGMRAVVAYAKRHSVRKKLFIMIGGAPVTEAFCHEIGADCYSKDATSCADAAEAYLRRTTK